MPSGVFLASLVTIGADAFRFFRTGMSSSTTKLLRAPSVGHRRFVSETNRSLNRHDWLDRPVHLALGCLGALLIRLAAYALMPGPLVSDESFQYLEQAHRIVYGTGLVPWEYVLGIRSWLLPGLLCPAFAVGKLLGSDPRIAGWLVAFALSLLSLPTVVCAALWARRAGGSTAALASGAAVASWFEIAAFAPHALADTVAASFLAPGLFLSGVARQVPRPLQVTGGGVLLGCALVLRPQLAPVVLAVSAWSAWRSGCWRAVIGLSVPVLLSGAVDWATWSYPFQSIVRYIWVNLALGGADTYGVQPWYAYLGFKLVFWGGLALPILLLIVAGSCRLPAVALCAVATALPFFILAHKEDRFLYPVLPLLFTLAGVGGDMVLAAIADRFGWRRWWWLAGMMLWPTLSAAAVWNAPFWSYLYQFKAIDSAVSAVNAHADVCGVAMHPEAPWARTPGYARYRPGVAIYGFSDGDPVGRTGAFNYIIDSSGKAALANAGFDREQCWDEATEPGWPDQWIAHACLWRRSGGCRPTSSPPLRPPLPAFLAHRPLREQSFP